VPDAFHILDPAKRDPSQKTAFETQPIPPSIGSHKVAAQYFQPDKDLVVAVNAALAIGAPLLITGEPGTGKTQIAYWLAWHFGIEDRLFPLYVRSTTVAGDLLYRFDTVAYLHAAHDPAPRAGPLRRADFIQKGPLWRALQAKRSIVLIDEIDKAPRDFPNDLLHVLEQHSFPVMETDEKISRPEGEPPPLVVISPATASGACPSRSCAGASSITSSSTRRSFAGRWPRGPAISRASTRPRRR